MSKYAVKICAAYDNGRTCEHAYNATETEYRTIMRFFESMEEQKQEEVPSSADENEAEEE